jgi:hypothetical protein
VAARPDHDRRNRQPRRRRRILAGIPLPGPGRCEPRPRLPGRGPRPFPFPGQDQDLAGTPSPGQHRKTPCRKRLGSAARIHPGPGRHGLALRLPPRRYRGRNLEPHHRRSARPPGPNRTDDPHPTPRGYRRHLAARFGARRNCGPPGNRQRRGAIHSPARPRRGRRRYGIRQRYRAHTGGPSVGDRAGILADVPH